MKKKFNSSIGSASVIIVIVIALAVVLGGIYFYKKGSVPSYTAPSTTSPTTSGTINQPPTASNDNSDANINQELQTAGTNLNSLDSTSTNIDSSMNQQQVDPTQ